MKVEKYLDATKYMWFVSSFDGIFIIPETAVYKKGDRFEKHDFDYYKTCSKKYLNIINELTEEAKKLNLSQIENILEKSRNLVSKKDIFDKFYSEPNNWRGMNDEEKRSEIVNRINEEVKNLEKNSNISHLRITRLNDNLKVVKREFYRIFAFHGEVYLINALKDRKRELEIEIKSKRGKDKRIQRIKERRAEQRK